MNSKEEVELVKAFMLRIAPEIARNALRTDVTPDDSAEQALYWAMHLTAKFTRFANEALKAIEEEQQQKAQTAEPV